MATEEKAMMTARSTEVVGRRGGGWRRRRTL
jgi:hypothetical protein